VCRHRVVPHDGTVDHPSMHHHSDKVITGYPATHRPGSVRQGCEAIQ
jgi:hypothetical protein